MGRDRRWPVGGLAFGGIVVTHVLAYRAVEHGHGARQALLDETGHRLWPWVATLGVAGAVAALGAHTARAARSPHHTRGVPFFFLVTVQTGGWLLLETFERLAFGGGHASLLDTPMVVGLLVQVAVALVATLLLALVAGVVRFLATARRRRREAVRRWRPPPFPGGCWPSFSSAAPRAPPRR
jgi:hypothetical protein